MYRTLQHLGVTILGDSSHNTSNAGIQAVQLPVQNPGKEEMLSLFSGISEPIKLNQSATTQKGLDNL